MAEHTPGPWVQSSYEVVERGVTTERGYFIQQRQGRDIARLPHFGNDAVTGEQLANARLIAKAPEMLEALEFIRDACVRLNDARAVIENKQEVLAEELDDIQGIVGKLLEEVTEPNENRLYE